MPGQACSMPQMAAGRPPRTGARAHGGARRAGAQPARGEGPRRCEAQRRAADGGSGAAVPGRSARVGGQHGRVGHCRIASDRSGWGVLEAPAAPARARATYSSASKVVSTITRGGFVVSMWCGWPRLRRTGIRMSIRHTSGRTRGPTPPPPARRGLPHDLDAVRPPRIIAVRPARAGRRRDQHPDGPGTPAGSGAAAR